MPAKITMNAHRFTRLSKGRRGRRGLDGRMNKTESAWSDELETLKRQNLVSDWWFKPVTLRLSSPDEGRALTLTPDFLVLIPDGRTFIDDVKGSGVDNDASIVRMKAAAEIYPLWRFRIIKRQTKKQGGGWKITEV